MNKNINIPPLEVFGHIENALTFSYPEPNTWVTFAPEIGIIESGRRLGPMGAADKYTLIEAELRGRVVSTHIGITTWSIIKKHQKERYR